MNVAILSDIHSNSHALEACLQYALNQGVTAFLFLGDYVGEMAYPQKTMHRLYELQKQYDCYFVKGNKEDYWLREWKIGDNNWKEYDSETGFLYYAYHNLTEKDLQFFDSLSHVQRIQFDELPGLTICHGSTIDSNGKMTSGTEATKALMEAETSQIIFCGHTHVREVYEYDGKKVINPGAVGTSIHSGGKAQFVILYGENGTWREEFVDLDYDVDRTIAEFDESGLRERAPGWMRVTEHMLRTGEYDIESNREMLAILMQRIHKAGKADVFIVYLKKVLHRAMALCKEETGDYIWPDMPNRYWEQAIEEIMSEVDKNESV